MDYYAEYRLSCYRQLEKIYDHKEVYLVREIEDGQLYVLKYVDKRNLAVYKKLEEFVSPYIPKIHEVIELEDQIAVVEQYINGMNLGDYVESHGVFTEKTAKEIVLKLCDVLSKLHALDPPVIHRDIKPSNIMIDQTGNVYLIDFNVAKEYSEGKTEDTVLMGTKEFAAPEQYGFRQSDARTDIYGLGATINYILTGEILKNKKAEGAFGKIIEKCTMLEPESRYQNMMELKKVVQKIKITARENEQDNAEEIKNPEKEIQVKTVVGEAVEKTKKKKIQIAGWPIYKWFGFITSMVFSIWLGFNVVVTNADGTAVTGLELILNKIYTIIFFSGVLIFWFDVGDLRYRLPFMRRGKFLHLIGCIVYVILWFFFMTFLLVIVEDILI